MRLLILLALLLLPVSAFAQWVDSYGNSLDLYRGSSIPQGSAGYRQPDGTISFPPIFPRNLETWSVPAPTLQPTPPPRSQPNRYEFLRDVTPGNSYSDSFFSDRVKR